MDPSAMMKMMGAMNSFRANHPKFVAFIANVFKTGIPADTVIELTVTKPGEESITTNIKVRQSDLDLFDSLRNSGL